jgi:sugar-specific transcriptional regulator TrmB
MTKPPKKNMKHIPYKCKKCLQTIEFSLDKNDPVNAVFPIILENTHGTPLHKLTVRINKHFKVDSFEIHEDVQITKTKMQSSQITREVLGSIGLTDNEIDLYLRSSGKGPMAVGELAILANLSTEEMAKTITKFTSKGLFKQIQGAANYYQALPPYAALLEQLKQFSNLIQSLKIDTPTNLQLSFSSFEEKSQGVQNLKQFMKNMEGIKSGLTDTLATQKEDLDKNLSKLKEQKKFATELQNLRDQSLALLDEHTISLFNQFELLKRKIANNLEKLHLGVIVNTVGDIVQKSIDIEMEKIQTDFQSQFENRFRKILDQLIGEITQMTDSATQIEEGVSKTFSGVLSQFNQVLEETETKLGEVSGTVESSFSSLRNTFSDEVVLTLDDVLGKIVSQIDMNIETIQEFWDESKRVLNFSMKDVWFIRTPEGMQAQINDTVSRAKMRVLIVAPKLSDIDIEPLKLLPNHINLRICCRINAQDPEHQKILKYLDSRDNFTYRERALQNLWAIHKDYEEIILGIVNENVSNSDEAIIEVAGIGSVLDEHIKMFVPIVEDAWMGATRELSPGFVVKHKPKPTISTPLKTPEVKPISKPAPKITPPVYEKKPLKATIPAPSTPLQQKLAVEMSAQLQKKVVKKPVVPPLPQTPAPTPTVSPTSLKQQDGSKKQEEMKVPVIDPFNPAMQYRQFKEKQAAQEEKLAKSSKTPQKEPKIKSATPPTENLQKMAPQPTTPTPAGTSDAAKRYAPMLTKLEEISQGLAKTSAMTLIKDLEELLQLYSEEVEFSRVNSAIANWVNDLKSIPTLDDFKRKILKKRLSNWKTQTLEVK